jgi:hypothetical protein
MPPAHPHFPHIPRPTILLALLLAAAVAALAIAVAAWTALPASPWQPLLRLALGAAVWGVAWTLIMHALCRGVARLPDGAVPARGRQRRLYDLYRLTGCYITGGVLMGAAVPPPLRMLFAACWGARLGRPCLVSGVITDPPLLSVGAGTVVGLHALLPCHAIEPGGEVIGRIVIGRDCLIGGHSVLMPGVRVGDGATVASGAVVLKGTVIPPGETWGGVPARRLHR